MLGIHMHARVLQRPVVFQGRVTLLLHPPPPHSCCTHRSTLRTRLPTYPDPGWYVTPRQLKSRALYDLTSGFC